MLAQAWQALLDWPSTGARCQFVQYKKPPITEYDADTRDESNEMRYRGRASRCSQITSSSNPFPFTRAAELAAGAASCNVAGFLEAANVSVPKVRDRPGLD